MPLTLNTKVYAPYRQLPDSTIFAGPANTISSTDTVSMRRVFPVPTKTDLGVAHPAIKVVKTLTLADGVTKKNMIVDIYASVPVGAASADVLLVLDDAADLIDLQEVKDLFISLDINAS